ncbi:MAG: EAL domain-containing protein [Campylobacterota bacterium]
MKQKLKNTSIQTKLIIPIIIIAIFSLLISTKVIEDVLNKQIYAAQKEEIKNFSNKLFYTLRSDFKTLFFEFGRDKEFYQSAKIAAQNESINNLQKMLTQTMYKVYIADHNNNIIPITQDFDPKYLLQDGQSLHERVPHEAVTILHNRFVFKKQFTPWNWSIITIKDTTVFEKIILENKTLIFATIFLMVFAILLLLMFVIHRVITKPLRKVFQHLNKIKLNKQTTALEVDSSKETALLSLHINSMSEAIKERELQLHIQKQRMEDILNSQTSIVIVSSGQNIKMANSAFFELFDRYKSIEEFSADHDCVCDFFKKVDKKGYIYKKEGVHWIEDIINSKGATKVMIQKDTDDRIFDINAKNIGTATNEYVVNLTDITSIERYKEKLEWSKEQLSTQLHTDELTKLPNRLSLSEKILTDQLVSLILININDFKEVNDFYGTQTGDKILYEYGQKLLELTRTKSYEVFKLSADEFALFTTNHYPTDAVVEFVKKLLKTVAKHSFFDVTNKRKINLTSTAGAAINAQSTGAFVNADIALKTAKKKKRPFMTYSQSQATKDEFASNIQWANKLKQAFKEDKIVPYFQPIHNNKNRKIEKYECLVRLIDEEQNPIAPFFFLDVAKKSHQYLQLTETMLDKSFHFFKQRDFEFSINLSESDLADFSINSLIMEKLKQYDIGNRVVFEIVESENIDDYEMVARFIKEVKSYGAKIAIDDFGAGFSNFQHVSQLNVDYLKIDGSLIQNILIDKNSETIVEAIATFAKRLEIKTIAEFVDSQEIQDKVELMGIDFTQGYLFGKPAASI